MHAHNNPITGFRILVIPDAISWHKVSNFGVVVATHELLDISFTYHDILKILSWTDLNAFSKHDQLAIAA